MYGKKRNAESLLFPTIVACDFGKDRYNLPDIFQFYAGIKNKDLKKLTVILAQINRFFIKSTISEHIKKREERRHKVNCFEKTH